MASTTRQYFVQEPPTLTGNYYEKDDGLQAVVRRILPKHIYKKVEGDLVRFGSRVNGELHALAAVASEDANEPVLTHYTGWGERVDNIRVCREWKELHDVAAEEGLIAIGYHRAGPNDLGEYARVVQMTKMYMFGPVSAVVTCPLAMTDGAARLVATLKAGGHAVDPALEEAFRRLTSTDPKEMWTSGQWMTERTGGSDVGGTETLARKDTSSNNPGAYLLEGYKYFTSATTADVAFTLARVVDASGKSVAGSRGLSLFFVRVRKDDGTLNSIRVHRLKKKIGTRPLPTAELELCGTPALLVGEVGRGVPLISTLFNLTRVYSVMGNVSAMGRARLQTLAYAERRRAFGRPLKDLPLHVATLADQELTYQACLALLFRMAHLLGISETAPQGKKKGRAEALLRLLTPVSKMYTGKEGMRYMAEACESFGGAGYMRDTGDMPQAMLDVMVNTIWEGTTNVLAHDTMRALGKDPALMKHFVDDVSELTASPPSALHSAARTIVEAASALAAFAKKGHLTEPCGRAFGMDLARTYAAALLVWHGGAGARAANVAAAYVAREHPLPSVTTAGGEGTAAVAAVAASLFARSRL